MTLRASAARYARALLDVVIKEQGNPEQVEQQLGAIADLLAAHPELQRALTNPAVPVTGKRGVDICIDSAGKAVHLSCIKSLARGGVFVTCGATSGGDATTDLTRVFWNQLSIVGSTMGDMNEFREVVALLRRGAIKPVIDSVFDSRDAAKAFARLESGEQFGKIVVRWP